MERFGRAIVLSWFATGLVLLGQDPELHQQFVLKGESGELSGVKNGDAVRPFLTPADLVGRVVVRGQGSVVVSDDGFAFLRSGQQNTNVGFLRLSGRGLGDMFDINGPGVVSFDWTSRYSFEERTALIASSGTRYIYRTAFSVISDIGPQVSVAVTVHDGLLAFLCTLGPRTQFIFAPKGSEDEWFGKGVKLNFSLAWDGRGTARASINGKPAGAPFPYTSTRQQRWSNSSVLFVGSSYQYDGGYFSSDDSIKNFVVNSNGPIVDTQAPTVRQLTLGRGRVSGVKRAVVDVVDDERVSSVEFVLDGQTLERDTSYPYETLVDLRTLGDGPHELAVVATDSSSNSSKTVFELAVANDPADGQDSDPPSPVVTLRTAAIASTSIDLIWDEAEDNRGVKTYRVLRNGEQIAEVAGASPGEGLRRSYNDSSLTPGTVYRYQIVAEDASGNVSPLSAPLELTTKEQDGRVLRVGPNGAYKLPCQALAAAKEWDTVEIDALGNGTYDGDVCTFKVNHLTILGVNGRPRIDAGGRSAGSKAVWVIDGIGNTVENIEISGCKVPDKNGAAIRMQARDLTLRGVYFHHNENGILVNGGIGGHLTVEFSEFGFNGDGVGYSHGLYVADIDKFVFRYSYSHDVAGGHLLKSRAKVNHILYSRLTDEGGTASYEIDLPNGGDSVVAGNLIQQTAKPSNPGMVTFGVEGLKADGRTNTLLFANNTLIDLQPNAQVMLLLRAETAVVTRNNLFYTEQSDFVAKTSSAIQQDNRKVAGLDWFHSSSDFDFSPVAGDALGYALDASASDPLIDYEYAHPAGGFRRPAQSPTATGAFHFKGQGDPLPIKLPLQAPK